MCPLRLTDIPISLTFKPSKSQFVSFIIVAPTVQQDKGAGEEQTARSGRAQAEGCVTQENKVIWKGLHRRTILKGTE
jgi:hypothetical protein